MTDLELMQQVERLAGGYLDLFAPSSSIPESFWAALTANESAGSAGARRFEPGVYNHLLAVASGKIGHYGSLTEAIIQAVENRARQGLFHLQFLDTTWALDHQDELRKSDDDTLRKLSTSWGFTQVMGYHSIEWGVDVAAIASPDTHLGFAARLMADFVKVNQLDPTLDFEAMARCWNTGRPNGATWDPNYVANLEARMKVWETV